MITKKSQRKKELDGEKIEGSDDSSREEDRGWTFWLGNNSHRSCKAEDTRRKP